MKLLQSLGLYIVVGVVLVCAVPCAIVLSGLYLLGTALAWFPLWVLTRIEKQMDKWSNKMTIEE